MAQIDLSVSIETLHAVSDVIHRYFWLVDFGRADEIPELFSAEGSLTFGIGSPKPGTISGEEIIAMFKARAAQTEVTTRHAVSNISLSACDDGTISAYSLLTLYRSDNEVLDSYPLMVADVQDCFVYENGRWVLKRRELTPIFSKQST